MTSYRFPEILGREAQKDRYPFVAIQPIKYRHQNKVLDFDALDSITGETIRNAAPKAEFNLNPKRTPGGDSFYLPLPTTVSNSYSPSWEMADTIWTSWLTETAANIAPAKGKGLEGLQMVGGAIKDAGGRAIDIALGGKFSQVFAGRVINPKKQALFNGIDPRSFAFDYTFSPQSLHEAELLERMIRSLVRYTLPKESASRVFYEFPYEFELTFYNVAGYPKISPCVCTSISTNYSPGQLQLLQSGHPVQITLNMVFLETSLRTRDDPGI